MIDNLLNNINDRIKVNTIFEICPINFENSINFYKNFPNAHIYIFEFDSNFITLYENDINIYKNRISLIKGNIYNYNIEIDICHVNNQDYNFIHHNIPINSVKLLINDNKILFNNSISNLKMFSIFENKYNCEDNNFYFTFYGLNEMYSKRKNCNNIIEYELDKYNPFLQKRGYMLTSAYLHVYWNKLYQNKEMIGFSKNDKHNKIYNNLNKTSIYIFNNKYYIVKNSRWNSLMYSQKYNLIFLIKSYNNYFNKNYTLKELENQPLSLYQTNIYPVKIYETLCEWLEKLVDEIYPIFSKLSSEKHFGCIGKYIEKAVSIFIGYKIYEGITFFNLNINHLNSECSDETTEQYKIILNNYSENVYTKYISNITGEYNVNFCMFKAECYLNNIRYNCERINRNKKNGLYFTKSNWINPREYGFDIEGEDPRLFILNNKVYAIFICLSPYYLQQRCIGLTLFDEWQPKFLQIENMKHNFIEKNWSPFIKDNKLYFVYNYDPLIIIHYDLNDNGVCTIVFKQENIDLPLNTSKTFLRGGSNLIHYKDNYYIGGCHSRIYKGCFHHYTIIILLDTKEWKIIYLSKPIIYYYSLTNKLNAWHEKCLPMLKDLDKKYNMLIDKTPNIIQDPISLYLYNDKYFITINVRDCVSLLYEIQFKNLLDFIDYSFKNIGYWDNLTKIYTININE